MSASGSGFFVTITTPKGSTVKRVEGDLLTVGRAEDCNLRIVHAELGRRHLTLTLQDGRCFVEDHASTNGTFINGKRLAAHTPTPINPQDQIGLAQSGIRLSVSADVNVPPPISGRTDIDELSQTGASIVTSTNAQRRMARKEAESQTIPPVKLPTETHEQSDRLVFEAQKKAALLIQQAEIESERKAQEVYKQAEEALEKAEKAYQRKLNEAFRESEVVYQKSQTESNQIIEIAKQKAAELRAQAEAFVSERRRRTDEDCERYLAEAQRTARELKENRLLEADDMIRDKEEEVLRVTREAMNQRVKQFEAELAREAERQRQELESEIAAKRLETEGEMSDLIEQANRQRREQEQDLQTTQFKIDNLQREYERESEVRRQKLEGEIEKRRVTVEVAFQEFERQIAQQKKELNVELEQCRTKTENLQSDYERERDVRRQQVDREMEQRRLAAEDTFLEYKEQIERQKSDLDIELQECRRKTEMLQVDYEKERDARREQLEREMDQQRIDVQDGFADYKKQIEKQKQILANEVDDSQAEVVSAKQEHARQTEQLQADLRQLREVNERESKALEVLESKVENENHKFTQLKTELARTQETLSAEKEKMIALRSEANTLQTSRAQMVKQIGETQARLATLTDEDRLMQNRINDARDSIKTEMLKLKDQFEAAKIKITKDEQAYLEQVKLDTSRKTQQLEQQMFEELQERKTVISREISLTVETFLKHNPDPQGRSMGNLQEQLDSQFETQIVSLSKDPSTKSKRMSLIALKRAERWRLRATGAILGAALLWGGQYADVYVRNDANPLAREVAAVAEQRRIELERRKFNPHQALELKDNYTDAVIYTQNFPGTYLDEDFQKKFLQAMAPYMLKTWRIEEDKSIQVIAASASLVKELQTKRESIHPDFVQKDIQKMHDLEAQSAAHIIDILGSQVRFESYKKFEKQFYENYHR
jgi:pSer/pThr/pTyr-binding forkhead associated (FHA) protein